MRVFNFVLLVLTGLCAKAQAEKCDVGVDGCAWTCDTAPTEPGEVQCFAKIAVPTSCEIGSSASACGTTCTCSQAPTCKVGDEGCLWTCKRAPIKPGVAICDALPGTPETCVVGSSKTICGTTCTCSQAKKCKVSKFGCTWDCVTSPPEEGEVECFAIPATPTECYPGQTASSCGTTCTCKARASGSTCPHKG